MNREEIVLLAEQLDRFEEAFDRRINRWKTIVIVVTSVCAIFSAIARYTGASENACLLFLCNVFLITVAALSRLLSSAQEQLDRRRDWTRVFKRELSTNRTSEE